MTINDDVPDDENNVKIKLFGQLFCISRNVSNYIVHKTFGMLPQYVGTF